MGWITITIPDTVLQDIQMLDALQNWRVIGLDNARVLALVDESTRLSERIGDILITEAIKEIKKRRLLA